jgi:hypothetical protein
MNDSFASWMIAGGRRGAVAVRHTEHLIAIRAARESAKADRPGIVERLRGRFGVAASPACDSCAA